MIEAYTVGITLALNNGVSEGVATIRRDLEALNHVLDSSSIGLDRLKQVTDRLKVGSTPDFVTPDRSRSPTHPLNEGDTRTTVVLPPTQPEVNARSASVIEYHTDTGAPAFPPPQIAPEGRAPSRVPAVALPPQTSRYIARESGCSKSRDASPNARSHPFRPLPCWTRCSPSYRNRIWQHRILWWRPGRPPMSARQPRPLPQRPVLNDCTADRQTPHHKAPVISLPRLWWGRPALSLAAWVPCLMIRMYPRAQDNPRVSAPIGHPWCPLRRSNVARVCRVTYISMGRA